MRFLIQKRFGRNSFTAMTLCFLYRLMSTSRFLLGDPPMSVPTISPFQLNDAVCGGQNVELIDVRTPAEFGEVHVPFAKNIPLDRLDASQLAKDRSGKETPLYVICRSGSRAKQACDKLMAAGCTDVVNVEGGTLAWDQAGLQVVRGKKVISLERQIRIIAGTLVFVGVMLGTFVHPYFYGLSAFVGLGLVFAGVTDICPMAMLVARMPWNQVNRNLACSIKSTSAN
jgi:rhodanese-related sulfurtransferase